ncbi:MAG: hypothetical protein ACREQY_06460, partial [Candidatus Binatia bacterium]
MRGDGFTYQRHKSACPNRNQPDPARTCSCVWWLGFYFRGEFLREPAAGRDEPPIRTEREARRKLRDRINSIRGDRYLGPQEEKLTIGDLLDALETHLATKGASLRSVSPHVKEARRHFGPERAVSLTAARIERYQAEELAADEPKAPATINRVVGTLRQAYRLARRQERISRLPVFPMLPEDNARQGFVEPETFEAIFAALVTGADGEEGDELAKRRTTAAKKTPKPRTFEDLADAARFAYLTGWRKGQISKLRWEHVDRMNRLLIVPGGARAGMTKNRKPHTIALEDE